MNGIGWPLVESCAQLLARDEREAVLGDLLEAGEGAVQAIFGIFGLIVRRQLSLWKNWHPWLAAFGVALPSSFLLMGTSVVVSLGYQHLTGSGAHGRFWMLACQAFLLLAWAWSGGFVVGRLSPRTLWASMALCFSPCLFCLARFRTPSLSRLSLLLFLLPALIGVYQGLRRIPIGRKTAIGFAFVVTAVMLLLGSREVLWVGNWLLLWPAWYMAVAAWKSGPTAAPSGNKRKIQENAAR
jgi:hypothetical protein